MRNSVIPPPLAAGRSAFALQTTLAPAVAQTVSNTMFDATTIAMDYLGLPFDVARAQYARAVQVGLIERSMLGSRNFSMALQALELLALGPWARHA